MSSWVSGLSELNMCTFYSKMSSNCVHVCMHIDLYNFFSLNISSAPFYIYGTYFLNYSMSEHFIHTSLLLVLLYYHLEKNLTWLSRSLNTYSYVNFINYHHFTCHFQKLWFIWLGVGVQKFLSKLPLSMLPLPYQINLHSLELYINGIIKYAIFLCLTF